MYVFSRPSLNIPNLKVLLETTPKPTTNQTAQQTKKYTCCCCFFSCEQHLKLKPLGESLNSLKLKETNFHNLEGFLWITKRKKSFLPSFHVQTESRLSGSPNKKLLGFHCSKFLYQIKETIRFEFFF